MAVPRRCWSRRRDPANNRPVGLGFARVGNRCVVRFDLPVLAGRAIDGFVGARYSAAGARHSNEDERAAGRGKAVKNASALRRASLVAMIIAIVSGLVSLFILFTAPDHDMTMAVVSAVALVMGLVLDRRAAKMDDRNAG